ncbi:MAG: selenium-dependent xanthine dehydrogenase [Elusimicrobia bacterium]|nr:selenium-dependent xanthine dehydrogenase [Elusimicrobiota bacterium]
MNPVAAAKTVRFTLNGKKREWRGDPQKSLLRWLRDDEGVITAKDGCSPQASCGCCTVHLSGKPVLSCVTAMAKVDGGDVVTPEGLAPERQTAFADAFSQCGGAQCGFCIPGIVMRADAMLAKDPSPSREDIARGLNQHLCRCTGYVKIVDAIETAAKSLREGTPVPAAKTDGKVGARLPKVDMKEAVLGLRPYVADMTLPKTLHGALRLSDHPRAKVLKVDAAEALGMPGVERVLTAADIPGQHRVGLIAADWPVLVGEGELTRYVGDVLAVVVAATRDQARAAAAKVRVDYEVLEPVTDVFEALKPGAPKVHETGNVLSVSKAKKGDVDAAFKRCAFVHEGVYKTQVIEHAYMEPEAALAEPTKDGVRVYSQGQGVYEDRRQLAAMLGLSEPAVEVVLVPNGGGFGGKEDLSCQGHAALAARLLGVPVKIELSRDESILMHPKRHPLHMEYKLGCSKDGELLALKARIYGDSGAYASVGAKVLERAAGHSTGAYYVPNVDVEATAVYTNNLPCGAMRGFGANQATFAMECAVDELCELGDFDRWKFRWANALTEGKSTATGQVLASGVGVRATLEAVKDRFESAKLAGIACGIKNTGIGNGMRDEGTARIFVKSPAEIELYHGWTEMGQGCDTIAVQFFCEETGLAPELVKVRVRTADEAPAGMTTASRATSLIGNAVIEACRSFKADLARDGLEKMAGRRYFGSWSCDWTTKPGYDTHGKTICTHYSYSYATQVCILDDEGRVAEMVAAHDAGRIINPTLFEGQIEGSVHMGLGYALTEDLPLVKGRPKTTKLRDVGVLRAREMPKVTVLGVEVPDEFGPHGAKGVGEIGLVPTAPAVANALYRFDGVRRRVLPMRRGVK